MKKLISLLTVFSIQLCAQNSAQLLKWKVAYGTALTSTTNARVLFIGDSTTIGYDAANVATSSYPSYFQSLAATAGYQTQQGLVFSGFMNGATANDARYTSCSANFVFQAVGNGYGPGFTAGLVNSAASGTCVFTPSYTGNTFSTDSAYVYYATGPGNGTLTATMTGGTAVPISTNGSNGFGRTLITAGSASTSNTISITASGSITVLLGVEPFLSTKGQVLIANAGVGGTTTNNWVYSNNGAAVSAAFGTVTFMSVYQPNLTVISLGINDCNTSVPIQTTTYNLQYLINAAKVYGDVVLMGHPPTNVSTNLACYSTLIAAEKSIAASNNIPYYDLYSYWGASYYTSIMYDSTHPNAAGYFSWGNFTFQNLFRN